MPTFRIDYSSPRGFLPDSKDDQWDHAPEQVTADGFTIDGPWLTFWATESRDEQWAPPPVLRVRAEDVGRIEWLDRPEPDDESVPIRISYKIMALLFTDDGDTRHRDELLVGNYSVGDDFISCGWDVQRPGSMDLQVTKPPVLAVRSDLVERIERVEPSIHPIPREPSST